MLKFCSLRLCKLHCRHVHLLSLLLFLSIISVCTVCAYMYECNMCVRHTSAGQRTSLRSQLSPSFSGYRDQTQVIRPAQQCFYPLRKTSFIMYQWAYGLGQIWAAVESVTINKNLSGCLVCWPRSRTAGSYSIPVVGFLGNLFTDSLSSCTNRNFEPQCTHFLSPHSLSSFCRGLFLDGIWFNWMT